MRLLTSFPLSTYRAKRLLSYLLHGDGELQRSSRYVVVFSTTCNEFRCFLLCLPLMLATFRIEQLEQLKLPQLDYFATAAESNEENSRCFNTDQARPICLEVKCDEVSYQVNVIVAGRNMTCDFGGQAHLIPDTNVTFFCPQLSSICPE